MHKGTKLTLRDFPVQMCVACNTFIIGALDMYKYLKLAKDAFESMGETVFFCHPIEQVPQINPKVFLAPSNKPCICCGKIYDTNEYIAFESGKKFTICQYDKLMMKHLLTMNDEDSSVKSYPSQKGVE